MVTIKPVHSEKAFETLAARLREQIITGQFEEGDLLSEQSLIAQSKLSRGSVREALRMLEAQGLIETRRGRNGGSFVVQPGVRPVVDSLDSYIRNGNPPPRAINETVELLEPGLARLAALHRTDADIAAMQQAIAALSEADSPRAFIKRNAAWHLAMAQASQNPILCAIYQAIGSDLLNPRNEDFLSADQRAAVILAATKILKAIEQRDPALAARRMARHVEAYHALLEDQTAPARS